MDFNTAADCRYAFQALCRRPKFTTIAVLTVALGIGAATSMFTVVDHVLLRPLQYKDADRLVTIWGVVGALQTDSVVGSIWNRFTLSYEDYEDWLHQQTAFEETAIFATGKARFLGRDETRTVHTGRASANFFSMLGTRLFRGRAYADHEDDAVVVAHEFWNSALGGDPNPIGRKITLDGSTRTVVGILQPHFDFAGYGANNGPSPEIWQPLRVTDPANPDYEVIGRLRVGIPLSDAERQTDHIFRDLRFAFLNQLPSLDKRHGARLEPRRDVETSEAKTPLIIMLLASGLLLLIACGNVANLLLGEAKGREHEVVVRSALGASRSRIVQQLIFESLLISTISGILGSCVAWLSIRGLLWFAPPGLPRINEIGVDGRILLFAAILSAACGIAFGLAPAMALTRTNLMDTLKNRGQHRGSATSASQGAVIVAEISICFVLLVGAALLAQSLVRLSHVDPGLNPNNLLAVQIALPMQGYKESQLPSLYQKISADLESLPGVTAVTGSSAAPFQDFRAVSAVTIDGKPAVIENRTIWPNYFDAVAGRFIEGRTFTAKEAGDESNVIIINKSMARQFWPNESAINKRIEYFNQKATIIGVTDDVRQLGLGVSPPLMYYSPMSTDFTFTVLIRTSQDPLNLAPAVRSRLRSIDNNIAINWIEPMQALVRASFLQERYRTLLITVFALSAVSLAIVGLYGVMSRYVAYRYRELGIRLAIGAQPRRVLALILYKGLILTAAGIFIGGIGAAWATRILSKYLFGIGRLDVSTYAAVALVLTAVALLTAYAPARRASRIDPVQCLRAE
ncbi:MAG TPA: ABC transporter permease [Terriglobia bacterium]|nr:ABC transporter permease [Terriglobia bacterium]